MCTSSRYLTPSCPKICVLCAISVIICFNGFKITITEFGHTLKWRMPSSLSWKRRACPAFKISWSIGKIIVKALLHQCLQIHKWMGHIAADYGWKDQPLFVFIKRRVNIVDRSIVMSVKSRDPELCRCNYCFLHLFVITKTSQRRSSQTLFSTEYQSGPWMIGKANFLSVWEAQKHWAASLRYFNRGGP